MHRRLATNDFLKKIGIENIGRCTFCVVELENLTHLFWFCTITSSFWQKFKQWLTKDKNFATIQDTDLTFSIIIGLRHNAFKTKKKTRYFIWICRVRDRAPQFRIFLFLRNLLRSLVNSIAPLSSFHSFDIKKPSVG